MIIRETNLNDLNKIDEIYKHAKLFMRENGNYNQWNSDYPNSSDSILDMKKHNSYVCVDDNNEVVATFAFIKGIDPTYIYIENGNWLNNDEYGVIHRIASLKSGLNILKCATEFCLNEVENIRIDTHHDNIVMQNALNKLNYQYCGIIYLKNGEQRLAYQLNKNKYYDKI